mmetsp:Transcript_14962/g.38384  ORF Transcript_14962/g.38384 Transcript_14962/m.38384 type:complete len:421 (+) Transcript_14962:1906-3168(+)
MRAAAACCTASFSLLSSSRSASVGEVTQSENSSPARMALAIISWSAIVLLPSTFFLLNRRIRCPSLNPALAAGRPATTVDTTCESRFLREDDLIPSVTLCFAEIANPRPPSKGGDRVMCTRAATSSFFLKLRRRPGDLDFRPCFGVPLLSPVGSLVEGSSSSVASPATLASCLVDMLLRTAWPRAAAWILMTACSSRWSFFRAWAPRNAAWILIAAVSSLPGCSATGTLFARLFGAGVGLPLVLVPLSVDAPQTSNVMAKLFRTAATIVSISAVPLFVSTVFLLKRRTRSPTCIPPDLAGVKSSTAVTRCVNFALRDARAPSAGTVADVIAKPSALRTRLFDSALDSTESSPSVPDRTTCIVSGQGRCMMIWRVMAASAAFLMLRIDFREARELALRTMASGTQPGVPTVPFAATLATRQ